MFTLELQWKEFNISLPDVKLWLTNNITEPCVGLSAHSKLEVHFENEPSEQDKSDILAYWSGLTAESSEATNYKTAEQIASEEAADKAAKIASATTKLEALGLTAEEIAAILG